MAQQKTNVMRILEKQNITYKAHCYDCSDGILDGVTAAAKIGFPPEKVFKTLVCRGSSKGVFVFVIPVAEELDLKKAARCVGEKSMEMIHVAEITPLTGYVRGGCSPLGMKKQFPTVFHSSALNQETIVVSGGKRGLQIETSPQLLAQACGGTFSEITKLGGLQ